MLNRNWFISALALSVLTNKKLKNSDRLKISADELSHMVSILTY